MNRHIPNSYIQEIGHVISNANPNMRILYIESDIPDILELATSDSLYLQEWMNIIAYVDDNQKMTDKGILRRLTNEGILLPLKEVYQSFGEYGILRKPTANSRMGLTALNPECFYIEEAQGASSELLEKMLQAFLESNVFPGRVRLVLTGTLRNIPETFADQIILISLNAPTLEDIEEQMAEKLDFEAKKDDVHRPFSDAQMKGFSKIISGLTYPQIETLYARIGEGGLIDFLNNALGEAKLRNKVKEIRQEDSKKDSTLEYLDISRDPGAVGVTGFMEWVNQILPDLVAPEESAQYGITPPTGVVLTGVPGTGKTLLAKQLAYLWSKKDPCVSLIELKLENLNSSQFSVSERKLTKYLRRVSENAPCVLLLDEVEKVFHLPEEGKSGIHDVTQNQMKILLQWMQDHETNVFCFLTSNNIGIVPPELVRSGRISERFFAFLPSFADLICMAYALLEDRAKIKGLFDETFSAKILKTCEKIRRYNSQFGTDEAKSAHADLEKAFIESALGKVLNRLAEFGKQNNRTPFLTGSDMKELINKTVRYLRSNNSGKGWTEDVFADAMEKCCCHDRYTPDAQSNLPKLVKLYLDSDFTDISATPLLPRGKYNSETGSFEREGEYIKGTNPGNEYDRYLQKTLVKEIEKRSKRKVDKETFEDEQIEHIRANWKKEEELEAAEQKARRQEGGTPTT